MEGIHVALAAETLGYFMGIPITNTLVMSWIVVVLLISIAVTVGRRPTLVPSRMQIFLEMIITGVYDFMRETLENDKIARKYLPLLLTIFLFIATANLIEFTPGIGSIGFYKAEETIHIDAPVPTDIPVVATGAPTLTDPAHPVDIALAPTETHAEPAKIPMDTDVHAEVVTTDQSHDTVAEKEGHSAFIPLLRSMNTDLNVTLTLAIIAVIIIEFAGIAALGFFRYAGKFITFSSPLNFVVGLIELVSEISRLISFSFRLFGNIFAGEVLLGVVSFFVPYVLPSGLMAFELFVGVVQGAVFSLLILFFIKLAITDAHAEAH
jgi:F-type H+-transporting ATPase subunit a